MKNNKLLTWTMVLALLLLLTGMKLTAQPEGLILWNKLGSDTEVANSEIGPNMVKGGSPVPTFEPGKFGDAVTFNNWSQYVTAPNLWGTNKKWGQDEFTFEFWCRINQYGRLGFLFDFLRGTIWVNTYLRLVMDQTNSGKLYLDGVCEPEGGSKLVTLPNGYDLGKWHHYAIVVTTSDVQFYYDGILLTSRPIKSEELGKDMPYKLDIGAEFQHNHSDFHFYGTMDNWKVYDYAKTNFDDRLFEGDLILWNKLGSDTEVTNSEIGVNGVITSTVNYAPLQFDNGVACPSGSSLVSFYRPFNPELPESSTIEFWWQPQYGENDRSGSSHFNERFPFVISGGDNTNSNWKTFSMRMWFGGHGGSVGKTLIQMILIDKSHNVKNWALKTYDLNFQANQLMHVGMTWDMTESDFIALYIDGIKQTPFYSISLNPETLIENVNSNLDGKDYNLYLHRWPDRPDGAAGQVDPEQLVDNLKIFNYAKTNFEDRFIEGVCLPPVVTCPADVTVNCDDSYEPDFTGFATFSEGCGEVLVHFTDTETINTECVNEKTVLREWIATDENEDTDVCTQTINIVDDIPPVITGVPIQSLIQLNDPEQCGAIVEYPLIEVGDNCGGEVELTFSMPTGSFFPVGATNVTVTATDACGNTTTDNFNVIVEDSENPVITLVLDPIVLWPPNHAYYIVNLSDFILDVQDNCSSISLDDVVIKQVSSDEPEDVNGSGDGNTTEDIIINPECNSVDLRAERQGSGNGRVYTITVAVADESNNEGVAEYQVKVPKSKNTNAVADGAVYMINGCGNSVARVASSRNVVEELAEFSTIAIYPNPVEDITTLKLPPEFETNKVYLNLHIYNTTGKRVSQFKERFVKNNSYEIDMSKLPSGLYILEIPEIQNARYKFIKQ